MGDIATGLVALIPMNICAMTDISQALDVLALCYRMPLRCIVNAGPQLRNLVNEDNHELTKRLSMQKIEVIVVPAGHKFCNPVKRSIQEVKKIFRNLNERASSSLFNQPNNYIDLLYKIALIENIMSLRPMLSNSRINIPPLSLQDCSIIPSWLLKLLTHTTSELDAIGIKMTRSNVFFMSDQLHEEYVEIEIFVRAVFAHQIFIFVTVRGVKCLMKMHVMLHM